ncbi:hypothetical protein Tco_0377139 [Tanacetum coccineum]
MEEEVAAMGPLVIKGRRKRGNNEAEANAPPKVLRRDHDAFCPAQSTRGGKSLASMGLDAGSILSTPAAQDPSTATKSVSDPEPLSSKEAATEIPTEKVATTEVNIQFSVGSPESGRSTFVPSVVGSPGVPPGYFSKLRHLPNADFLSQYNINLALEEEIKKLDREIKSLKTMETEVHGIHNQAKNLETLLEAEVDMKKTAKAKNVGLAKEIESLRAQFAGLQVSNNQLSEQVSTLQTQMNARLDKLSVYFDEELYPHMLTVITGRRWVIGHGLRLAVMKCAKSSEIRQAFADVVSAGLAKGMSKGLKYGIEHEKASRDLADIEAYDPEANSKLVKALQDLKDLKYPMIRDLRPSSSQLKIPVYPEVRDPEDLWAVKEEMLLEDAIAANISRAKKKKKCRVVYRTYGIGSAHHTRSDGIPVSAPTVVP